MADSEISAKNPYPYKRAKVLDAEMAYFEAGSGDPIVLLHGNPTTSYLWRNVVPHLEGLGRCLVPDLMNSGASDNIPDGGLRFADHIRYLDAWFEAVGATKNVIFVIQDWGAALGFYRTCRFPDQVDGIVYMEAMVRPRFWTDLPEERVPAFKKMRSPEGEAMIMETNFFIEKMLFERGVIRALSDEEKDAYREPAKDDQKRRQTRQWACEIPFEGEPEDNYKLVKQYSDFLGESHDLPKLFVNCDEGHALAGASREHCRQWPNQEEITLNAKHYVQEDRPVELGQAAAAFIKKIRG